MEIKMKKNTASVFWANRFSFGSLLVNVILLLIFVITFYPFFYVLFLSVMPYANYIKQPVHVLPDGFTLIYFQDILKRPEMMTAFGVSILRTLIGTTLSVVITCMAGYALSRRTVKWARFLSFIFLIPMFFNAGLIPYYLVITAVGLKGTFGALILPSLVLPMWMYIARSAFAEYPREIIECATLDGAGQFTIFWKIVWPTSFPIFATLAVMYGTYYWNEYFFARIVVGQDLWPATAHLYNLAQMRTIQSQLGVGVQMIDQSYMAAIAALLIIPVLVIYPLLQKYVIAGVMVGAVKE
jgi:putative aldouronate transport system permease protein